MPLITPIFAIITPIFADITPILSPLLIAAWGGLLLLPLATPLQLLDYDMKMLKTETH